MSGAPEEMSSGGPWIALGTLALLLAALSVNSRILLGIVVGAAIFVPIERLFGLHPQRVFRAGWMTDMVHLIVSQALTLVGLVIGGSPSGSWPMQPRRRPCGRLSPTNPAGRSSPKP